MLELATAYRPNHEEGRWAIETRHAGDDWVVIVEPLSSETILLVITANHTAARVNVLEAGGKLNMHRRAAVVELVAILCGMLVAASSVAEELKLWYEKPAVEWTEALPIGNGRLGAMIFGGTERERIQFNDNTLFTGRPHDYAHDGAKKHLPVLRQLLFDGKQDEAHELASREFMSVSTRDGQRQNSAGTVPAVRRCRPRISRPRRCH